MFQIKKIASYISGFNSRVLLTGALELKTFRRMSPNWGASTKEQRVELKNLFPIQGIDYFLLEQSVSCPYFITLEELDTRKKFTAGYIQGSRESAEQELTAEEFKVQLVRPVEFMKMPEELLSKINFLLAKEYILDPFMGLLRKLGIIK